MCQRHYGLKLSPSSMSDKWLLLLSLLLLLLLLFLCLLIVNCYVSGCKGLLLWLSFSMD